MESEYTSAALKTCLALEAWWKLSPANYDILCSFARTYIYCVPACMLPMQAFDSTTEKGENVGCIPSTQYKQHICWGLAGISSSSYI